MVAIPSSKAHPARVAVIVPAYGLAVLIAEALQSLQAQTLPDWECIVIDDGSPDDVSGAVAPFLADPRIHFLATDNRGVSGARNRAIREATAPLVALLDGDDLLRPDYLANMVPTMEADPAIRFATCNARIFGAVPQERLCFDHRQGKGVEGQGTLADVLDRSFGVYIGSIFRRADFDAIGGFDESMAMSEDFDLWVRLLQLGGEARYVDRVMCDYRVRASSASSDGKRMLLGNLKVYEKARDTLPPDCPEQALLQRLIARQRDALAFEHAIDWVIGGDRDRGLAALSALHGEQVGGAVWRFAFSLWRLFPGLAPWMLRWRRQAHARGQQGRLLQPLRAR
ncbi:MAG: glycosyltransferase family A protein [Novosphingobium sp.]